MNTLFNPNLMVGLTAGAVSASAELPAVAEGQSARVLSHQKLLFPNSPRAVCEQLGLTWWAACKLYEDGWLSFAPEATPELDEAQEAELRFVGALSLAGCDRRMMVLLLSGLSKPYSYQLTRIYYEWSSRRWRVLPESNPHPEAVFSDWLDALVARQDTESLHGVIELAHDALARIHAASRNHH